MGTKQVGSSATPSYWTIQDGQVTTMENAFVFTMPEDGWVDVLWFYGGPRNATANMDMGIYDGNQHLVPGNGSSGGYTTANNSVGVGYAWHSFAYSLTSSTNNGGGNSPYLYLWSGYAFRMAVYCDQGLQWKAENNGGHYYTKDNSNFPQTYGGYSTDAFGGASWPQNYLTYFPRVQITGLTSTPVAPGQTFTITGRSYTAGINSITVNGVAVTTYTVNSDTQITATVPAGASSGPVYIDSKAGTVTSGTTLSISSAYALRTGVWTSAGGVYVDRTGTQTVATAVDVYRTGVWTPGS